MLALPANVVQHQHGADRLAGTIADQRHRRLDRHRPGTAPRQQQDGLVRPALLQRQRHQVGHRRARAFVVQRTYLPHRQSLRFHSAPAGQQLRRRVKGLDPPPYIRGDDGVADRLQGHLRTFLLGKQLGLGQLLLGNVGQ